MPETFLILLSGGVMFASAVPDPRTVTLRWLRLAGIIGLCMAGLSVFFWWRREGVHGVHGTVEAVTYAIAGAAVLGQLALAQVDWRRSQRLFAWSAFVAAVAVAFELSPSPARAAIITTPLACAGVAVMTGMALMDMLLGHAYLTASQMTMQPFRRLNLGLASAITLRAALAMAVTMIFQAQRPAEMLWPVYGLYVVTRWLVGLVIPSVFIYMAQDCINRRATQSATGILYVTGVLIFIGELIGLYLLRETGLPF